MPRLYLVRHGRADSTGEVYDRLTDTGHRQAELLADYLVSAGVRPDAVYHGTLQRQRETAEHLTRRSPALSSRFQNTETASLNEFTPEFWGAMSRKLSALDQIFAHDLERYLAIRRKGGRRSMVLFLRLTEAIFERWATGMTPEGCESFDAFENRVLTFTEKLLAHKESDTVVVFSSGTPLSIMIARLLGWDRSRSLDWMRYLQNTSLSVFLPGRSGLSPAAINSLGHLPPDLHTLL